MAKRSESYQGETSDGQPEEPCAAVRCSKNIRLKNEARKKWTDNLKKNSYALYLVSRDPRVSVFTKILIGVVVAYALSPIDLIPDFIPVIGYLDDLLILPLGIWLAVRLIPQDVWAQCQELARQRVSELPESHLAAAVIVTIWVLAAFGLLLWIGSFI